MSWKTAEVEREARRAKVAVLLTARVPYRQIAAQLGVSLGTISGDVAALLAQWAKEQRPEDRNRWRAVELMKLDEMEMRATNLLRMKEQPDISQTERILRIMERRAKLLGLDEPTRIEGSISVPITLVEVERTVEHEGG